jgi:hypothetical protein
LSFRRNKQKSELEKLGTLGNKQGATLGQFEDITTCLIQFENKQKSEFEMLKTLDNQQVQLQETVQLQIALKFDELENMNDQRERQHR